jgi:rRNA maturation protein Rpf1
MPVHDQISGDESVFVVPVHDQIPVRLILYKSHHRMIYRIFSFILASTVSIVH